MTTATTATHEFFGIGGAIDTSDIDEALIQAGLNFTVSQQQNLIIGKNVQFSLDTDETGRPILILDEESPYNGLGFNEECPVVRDDTLQPIANMGSGYKIMQNRECAGILEDILRDEPDIELVRGGHIKNCERLFICARLPNPLEIGMDRIEKYILIMWSHTGKAAITIRFLPTLVSTKRSIFLNSDKEVSIRHTRNGPKRLSEAGNLLFSARKYFESIHEVYQRLVQTPFDDEAMDQYLNQLFPDTENLSLNKDGSQRVSQNVAKRETILDIWQRETAGKTRGSRWDAMKSVCEFTETSTVKTSKKKGFTEGESRLDNVWHGSGSQIKNKAQTALQGE